MITDEKIKEILVRNSKEWIKDKLEDISILRVEDFIEELQTELKKNSQPVVEIKVCKCEKPDPYTLMPYKCFRCGGKIHDNFPYNV
jgi:hypothetical protein